MILTTAVSSKGIRIARLRKLIYIIIRDKAMSRGVQCIWNGLVLRSPVALLVLGKAIRLCLRAQTLQRIPGRAINDVAIVTNVCADINV